MPDASFSQHSFLGGEWSKYVQGRADRQDYRSAMNLCRNAFPVEEGACTRRPGTILAGPTRNGVPGVLFDFDFSQNHPYTLEFTPGYLRLRSGASLVTEHPVLVTATSGDTNSMTVTTSVNVFSPGDQVVFTLVGQPVGTYGNIARLFGRQFSIQSVADTSDFTVVDSLLGTFDSTRVTLGSNVVQVSRILTFTTPYTAKDLATLNIVQTDTSVYVLSVNHPTQVLTQVLAPTPTSFATFTFAAASFTDGPYLDPPTDGSYLTPGGTTSPVTLTGTNAAGGSFINFQPSDVGRLIRLFSEPAAYASGTTYSAGQTVKFANAYWSSLVNSNTGHQPDLDATHWAVDTSAAAWTWGTITSVTNPTVAVATLGAADPLGVAAGGPLLSTNKIYTFQLGVYSATTGYPSCGTFHEGRVWFGTSALGNRFDASMSNKTNNFAPTAQDGTVADDNGISEVLEAADVSTIFWMQPGNTGIVMGTQSGEWLVQASQLSDPLTPTSIQGHRHSHFGSENIQPRSPPFSLIFVRRFGRKLTELIPDTFSGRLVGRNLSETGAHLCASGIKKIAYQQETTPIIWCLMNDGTLAGLTYRRDSPWGTQPPTFAGWHKHALGTGRKTLDIAVGPSADGKKDSLTLLTQDPATGYCFVELLTDIFLETDIIQNAWFVDGAVNPGGLDVINGNTLRFYGLDYVIGKTITVWGAGLDLGDYVVPSTGQIDVPFSANSLFTTSYIAGLQGSAFNYQTTLVGLGGGTAAYTMAAWENYDPATRASFPTNCYSDQQAIGCSYDRKRRALLYPVTLASASTLTNSTGFDLWSGEGRIANSATYNALINHNLWIGQRPIDPATDVTFYNTFSTSKNVPSGIGAGAILTFTLTGGTGYTPGQYNGVFFSTSGSGSGSAWNITVNGAGVVSAAVIDWLGAAYAVNDTLTDGAAQLGAGSNFKITVNSVWAGSDGTALRYVQDTSSTGGDLPNLVDPYTGNFWVHVNSCELYLFRRIDSFVQVISPFFPTLNANAECFPVGVTANWLYCWENGTYAISGGVTLANPFLLHILPSGITAAETSADKLISTYDYAYPAWFTTAWYRHAVGYDGNLYTFGAAKTGARDYRIFKAVPGTGWTDITPWTSSTGPNSNIAGYTSNSTSASNMNGNVPYERNMIIALPATQQLALISKFLPKDKGDAGWVLADYRVDCTYYNIQTQAFDYHQGFITGYMDANFQPTTSGNQTYNVYDCRGFDNALDLSDFPAVEASGAPVDYTLRWFVVMCSGTSDITSQERVVFVQYKFVSGQAPQVVQIIDETNAWDANTAYAAYAATLGNSHIVWRSMVQGNQESSMLADPGIFDPVTASFWMSGANGNPGPTFNFFQFTGTFSGRSNSSGNPSPPFLVLSFTSPTYQVAPFTLGFNYEQDCQIVRALDPREAGAANGPALGKTRRSHMASVLFNGAQGVSVGTDFTNMRAITFKLSATSQVDAPLNVLYNDIWQDTLDDTPTFDSMFAWKVTRPYPCTVVAVEQFLHTADR